jgi:hypothetical protein
VQEVSYRILAKELESLGGYAELCALTALKGFVKGFDFFDSM